MRNLSEYISTVKSELPDIEGRLNGGADKGLLSELEDKAGCSLPSDFIKLYSLYDGEDFSKYTGFMAGMEFLPINSVLAQLEFFKSSEYEMTAWGTRAIREEPMCSLNWIPFAYDNARGYLAVDMSPSESGKAGQIITVDYDFDRCYLLADSLNELFAKMAEWLENGVLTVNTKDGDEPFIMEKTGHLFNSLEELTQPQKTGGESEIPLDCGFWQNHYGRESVPVSELCKEKYMLISDKTLSCEPFSYMDNLKELIFHNCALWHLDCLAKAPQLKKLIFVNCVFANADLSALCAAPQLKELSLNVMDASGLDRLSELPLLKSLSIRKVTGIELEALSAFTKLSELSIEDMGLCDGTFIGKLINLKNLDLHSHTMNDLDFLAKLTKLKSFTLQKTAVNEDGLLAIPRLTKLKEFIYPVRDLSIYANHPTLEAVGMAPDVKQEFEVFKGSKVNSFMICGNIAKEEVENMAKEMDRYVRLYSYGTRSGG